MKNITTNSDEFSQALTETLSAVLFSQPFFAAIWCDKMKVVEVSNDANGDPTVSIGGQLTTIPTAATDGKTMWFNREFISSIPVPERLFVFCHEVMHAVFLHMPRQKYYMDMGFGPDMKPFSAAKWNKAADYIINAGLSESGIGSMPSLGLISSVVTGEDLLDDVYMRIPDPEEDDGKGKGKGGGEGSAGDDGGMDKHIPAQNPISEADEVDMQRAVHAATAQAKAMGKLPGTLERLFDQVLNPKVQWEHVLRQEVTMHMSRVDNNWNKPNRRRLAMNPAVILPSTTGTSSGTIVVQIDTSGSIGKDEVSQFLGEIKSICEDTRPEFVKILWVDTRVAHVDDLEQVEDITDVIERLKTKGIPGGGGTDMTAGFEYIAEWGIEPNSMVILTDGYTPFGERQPYPVIWGMTTSVEAPWGENIHIDVGN